jgi:hypothetical protein
LKITVTLTGIATPFVLGDDTVTTITASSWPNGAGGAILEGFINKQKRELQRTLMFQSAYLLDIPKFNWENAFSFTVQRSFNSLANCIYFIANHPDTVPAGGEITLSNNGSNLRYLPSATIDSVECVRQIGLSCDFRYAVSAGNPWQSSP